MLSYFRKEYMGTEFFDEFSLLHFASGVIAQYWGISFSFWFLIHFLFEVIENTAIGVSFIDNYLVFWPGGKLAPDAIINRVGDHIFALLGWEFSKITRNLIK